MKFVSDIRLLLTGMWLGAAAFFIAVAQSAFGILPTTELAGNLVSATLMILNISGFIIGLFLLLTSLLKGQGFNSAQVWVERVLAMVMTLACGVGEFVFGFWLSSIKVRMGAPIDSVPKENALRMQFDNLHEYSVWVLLVGMLAALLIFFVIAGKNFIGSSASKINFKTPV